MAEGPQGSDWRLRGCRCGQCADGSDWIWTRRRQCANKRRRTANEPELKLELHEEDEER
jgi:hypothetical protein